MAPQALPVRVRVRQRSDAGWRVTSALPAIVTVDENESRCKEQSVRDEIAAGTEVTQMYSLRVPGTSPALVLDVFGGTTSEGSAVKLWAKGTDSAVSCP